MLVREEVVFAAHVGHLQESQALSSERLGSPALYFPVQSDPLEKGYRLCARACLITADLYTTIGMVSSGVRGLSHVVYFFIDRAFKLVVDPHEINKAVHVYESRDDPENELEGAQVHTNELLNIGALDFDGNRLAGRGEDRFMDLTKRGGSGTFALQHAEHLLNGLA